MFKRGFLGYINGSGVYSCVTATLIAFGAIVISGFLIAGCMLTLCIEGGLCG